MLGEKLFKENDADQPIEHDIVSHDNEFMRIIDFPLVNFDGPNLEDAFRVASQILTNVKHLIGQRNVACLVCKSAMKTRFEAPLLLMLQCVSRALKIKDFYFLATFTDCLTVEAKDKKLVQYLNELPKLLKENKLNFKGSIERDNIGKFQSNSHYQQFLAEAQPLKETTEQINQGLFSFGRRIFFKHALSMYQRCLLSEYQRSGFDFLISCRASSKKIKVIQQRYQQDFCHCLITNPPKPTFKISSL
ncbi:hypothetical protein FGO68_gene1239 [Halteria grandinella]|uniref:Uncharacterized protein n=1 Tax=Halteria grandinella TaxID=5974 RepID=A0A8J8T9K0_HALGN|nr:hypothetical protein FGO68_gene1239 [Halteria grandinella]